MQSEIIHSPIFIVGMPRSGTTLLANVMSSSKELCICPELWFFSYWVPKYQFLDLSKKKDKDFFLEIFLNSKRFGYLELSKKEVNERIQNTDSLSFCKIFEIVLDEYRKKHNKVRVGEKTPIQFRFLKDILECFPNSKVIYLLRNPMAVSLSLKKVPFGSDYVSVSARAWKNYMKLMSKYEGNSNFLRVSYEDLVTQSNEVLQRIAHFLEIELDTDKATSFRGGDYTTGTRAGWGNQHFEKANAPVNKGSLDKWRKELTKEEKSIIYYITKEYVKPRYQIEDSGIQTLNGGEKKRIKKDFLFYRISNLKKRLNILENKKTFFIHEFTYKLGFVYERN